jgi:hypothetical protein
MRAWLLLSRPYVRPRDHARAELVPSFYEMQKPIAGSNRTKAFNVSDLDGFYRPQKGRVP